MQEMIRLHNHPGIAGGGMPQPVADLLRRSDSPTLRTTMENTFQNVIEAGKAHGMGYIKGLDGRYYSYHFWAYPLLSIPFRILVDGANGNPLHSFILLNAALLALAVGYTFRIGDLGRVHQILLAIALIYTCTLFYLNWIHPEIFSAAFLWIAFVCFLNRQFPIAMLAAAVASLQNPPIAFTLPLFYLRPGQIRFRTTGKWHSWIFPFTRIKDGVLTGMAAAVVLLPGFWFQIVYGHPNPIIDLGGASFKWVSPSRVTSIWMDLNQGMILGFPGLIPAVFVIATISLLRQVKDKKRINSDPYWMLFALIVISIPCASQGNWNAGGAMMLRYGLWIGLPLWIVLFFLLRDFGRSTRVMSIGLIFFVQALVPVYSGFPSRTRYLTFTPVSQWVMQHFPHLYLPQPEIFAERAMHQEGVLNRKTVFHWREHPERQWFLVRKEYSNRDYIWGENMTFERSGPAFYQTVDSRWQYVVGQYESRISIDLEFDHKQSEIFGRGWSYAEGNFRWSTGEISRLIIPLSRTNPTLSGLVKIGFEVPGRQKLIRIRVDDHLIYDKSVIGYQEPVLHFDPEWISKDELDLEIEVRHPHQSEIREDTRKLGIRFHKLILQGLTQ